MAKEAAVDPIELPLGPITRSRAKKFREALLSYIDRAWIEEVAGLIDYSWSSTTCVPCSHQLNQLARHWMALKEINVFEAELKTKLLFSFFQKPLREEQWPQAHSH
ncbi:hypothetical protein PVK06_002024 [Gossypium arboreum]|uniref:Uncharacterized protein n=1 Tax=Gossypium arboreum TaxID=29729 RepID=A0ABR0R3V7_GOSAR|nr:hypothetical protein PVK06_002024 [Gossypium arboreum]